MPAHKRLLFFAAILGLVFCSSPREKTIILCAGDSITDSEYPCHLRRLFSQEGRPVRVLNYGRKGNTSGEYLRFLKQQQSALARTRPDFVLLELGTNDVRVDVDFTSAEDFGRNMKAIIAIFKGFRNPAGGKTTILLATIPPIPEGLPSPFGQQSPDRVVREINPLIAKIAAEEGIVLVDNYSVFSKSPHLLSGVHPTSQGYRALARNWHDALKPWLNKQKEAVPFLR
jgi:lysophospholipase L1-like esterase